jgi:hypothetical protein
MVVLMLAATVVTFSRIGLVTAVIGAVVTVLSLGGRLPARLRVAVVAGLVVVGAASASLVSQVFSAAGAEATNSADYRLELLKLVPDLMPFGYSSSAYTQATGQLVLANVQSSDGTLHSIDNALLLVGLTYGWVPLAFVLAMLVLGLACVLSGRAAPPTIAVLAQVPAFATVALITQYSTVTWFMAGLAVYAQSVAGARSAPLPRQSPEMVGDVPEKQVSLLS